MKKLSKQEELALVRAIKDATIIDGGIADAYNEKPRYNFRQEWASLEDWGEWDDSGLELHKKYNLRMDIEAYGEEGEEGEWGEAVYLYPRETESEDEEANPGTYARTHDYVMVIEFEGPITCRRDPEPWRDHRDNEPEYWYEFEPLTDEDINNGKYKIEYEEEK